MSLWLEFVKLSCLILKPTLVVREKLIIVTNRTSVDCRVSFSWSNQFKISSWQFKSPSHTKQSSKCQIAHLFYFSSPRSSDKAFFESSQKFWLHIEFVSRNIWSPCQLDRQVWTSCQAENMCTDTTPNSIHCTHKQSKTRNSQTYPLAL